MDGKDKVVGTYHGFRSGHNTIHRIHRRSDFPGTFYLFADRHLIAIVDPDTVAGSYIALCARLPEDKSGHRLWIYPRRFGRYI